MQSWTIGILCYNESGSIRKVFDDVLAHLKRWGVPYEIILVDDGSKDGSQDLCREISNRFPETVRFIEHPKNLGIGPSIRDVYFHATKENVIFVPGDGQFDLQELVPYPEFSENTYLAFYRKENQTYSVFRNILSLCNKLFNQYFLLIEAKDVNWVKAYKTKIITALDLKSKSSLIESEICGKLHDQGIHPIQIESKYLDRIAGKSKGAALLTILRVIPEMVKLIFIIWKFRFTFSKKKI